MNNLCENCKSLREINGYCLKFDTKLLKQRQSKKYVRCLECVMKEGKEK